VKYLCEACERLIPPAAFRVEQGVLVMTCSRCGGDTRGEEPLAVVRVDGAVQTEQGAGWPELGAQAPRRPEPARTEGAAALNVVPLRPTGDQVRTAAELARSGDAFSVPPGFCPKCIGVRREGASTCPHCGLEFVNFRPEEHQPSPALEEDWLEVLQRWDDPAMHDRMLSKASARGELVSVGRLYRIRLAQVPEDLYARRGREEVMRLAAVSASTALTPSGGPDRKQRMRLALVGFLFVVAFTVVISLLLRLRETMGE
jgi:predicted  nucleic acid-binding Zn-ribbon protein